MKVFLDTSIFVQQNFFTGKKMEHLSKLANQKIIDLFITSVNDREIEKKITDEYYKFVEAENFLLKKVDSTHKIVKNFYDIEDLRFASSEYLLDSLLSKYRRYKEFAKIQIIQPCENFDINSIISDYFNIKPPFSNTKEKKSEFPDAISVKIITDYLKSKNTTAIYLTVDKDFDECDFQNLEIKKDIDNILEEIGKSINPKLFDDETNIKNTITQKIDLFKPFICEELELSMLMHVIDIFNESVDSNYILPEIRSLDITDIIVFDVTDTYVGFNCSGNYIVDVRLLNKDNLLNDIIQISLATKKIIISDNKLSFRGQFHTSLYYEYEFPYEILQDSIEISEDELIKTIENI